MTQLVEIEGNIARIVQREITHETTLAAIGQYLEVHAPSLSPALPRGAGIHTVHIAQDVDKARAVVLIEREPNIHSMNLHFDVGQRDNTQVVDMNRAQGPRATAPMTAIWNIQLPYLYFLYGCTIDVNRQGDHFGVANFAVDTTQLYMRPTPLRSMDEPLWNAKLPNVNQTGRICWGNTVTEGAQMATRLYQMVSEFADTTFNNHYGTPMPKPFTSMTEWEKASKPRDPFSFQKWTHWNTPAENPDASLLIKRFLDRGGQADYGDMPIPQDFTDVLIPMPPIQFTIGRIHDWIATLPEARRTTFIAVLRDIMEHPEATADAAFAEHEADLTAALDELDDGE